MRKTAFLLLWAMIFLAESAFAQDKLTIIYTGETHASMYPCSCPVEPDGGIARRATAINQIRSQEKNLLVLDSGGFFAGGVLDEHSQAEELDKARTKIQIQAMDLMGYDAAAVGDEELNFGAEFFKEATANSKIKFLSCNIKMDNVLPYLIREINGIRVGIIGLTTDEIKNKINLKSAGPESGVLEKTIGQLRRKGTSLIIVLSHIGEEQDTQLALKVKGIDILISGHRLLNQEPYKKIESTLILYPSWQGRRLGRVDVVFQQGKIKDITATQIRLSQELADDPKILSILPECFSVKDCKGPYQKSGLVAKCLNPGTKDAKCAFDKPKEVSLVVIAPSGCRTCNTQEAVLRLKAFMPLLKASFLDAASPQAKNIIATYKITMLPAYLLSKDVSGESVFPDLSKALEEKKEHYLISPSFIGVSYFLGREKVPGRLDLFISTQDKVGLKILEPLRNVLKGSKIDFHIHFLVREAKHGGLEAIGGAADLEEAVRMVCIMKSYPQDWWDYLICRGKFAGLSAWEDCLKNSKIDAALIKNCSLAKTGTDLLRENIQLTGELKISTTPIFLLDNQEVFGIAGTKGAEEKLREILLGKK